MSDVTLRNRVCVAAALAAAATLTPLSAQNYVVAPPQYAAREASAGNGGPFGGIGRYQQIHGELRGTARTLQALAWRRDGIPADNTVMVARTPDLQIVLADSNLAGVNATFANNLVGPATTVFARRPVNGPDFTRRTLALPAPWSLSITFDAPYPYAGTADLVYDVTTYNNTSGNPYEFDAASGRDSSMWGGSVPSGSGCNTSNGSMNLFADFLTNGGTGQLTLKWTVLRGPSAAPSAVLVGLTNPNLFSTLVCGGSFLYTDAMVMVVGGTTDAFGGWITPTITAPFRPGYVGATLTAQAAALDQAFAIVASNGQATTVAPVPVALQMNRVVAGSPTATTGTVYVGYGLVTRFQY